ncbi:unnamed protein product [Rhizophagus irregularis]|nr:unnamed protein product [Rhizophagus irregularis]
MNQPVIAAGFSREPTGLVHVFIDNSNVYIQRKKFVSKKEGLSENLICIDYGRLFKTVLDGYYPVIVGSRPPPDDSLWKILKILDLQLKLTIERALERVVNCRDMVLERRC